MNDESADVEELHTYDSQNFYSSKDCHHFASPYVITHLNRPSAMLTCSFLIVASLQLAGGRTGQCDVYTYSGSQLLSIGP